MQICTYEQCAQWCAAHGYATRQIKGYPVGHPDLTELDFRFALFSIPGDAGRRVALVKELVPLLDANAELLVQISDWSVWASGEHMPLFDRFREAFGERRPLIEAPGHVVPPAERDDAVSILVVSVLYLWNCHLLSANGDQALFVSHDEYGWFAVRGERNLEGATEVLERFGVLSPAAADDDHDVWLEEARKLLSLVRHDPGTLEPSLRQLCRRAFELEIAPSVIFDYMVVRIPSLFGEAGFSDAEISDLIPTIDRVFSEESRARRAR